MRKSTLNSYSQKNSKRNGSCDVPHS